MKSYVLQSIGYWLHDLGLWFISRGNKARLARLDKQFNYLAKAGEYDDE